MVSFLVFMALLVCPLLVLLVIESKMFTFSNVVVCLSTFSFQFCQVFFEYFGLLVSGAHSFRTVNWSFYHYLMFFFVLGSKWTVLFFWHFTFNHFMWNGFLVACTSWWLWEYPFWQTLHCMVRLLKFNVIIKVFVPTSMFLVFYSLCALFSPDLFIWIFYFSI